MQYASEYEAKEKILEAGRRLYARGLVSGNEGNISIRVSENEVWCTPTYESKGYLNRDMLVKLDLEGNVLSDNGYEPSSEVKMHLGIYKEHSGINAVIHAHPLMATAYACSKEEVKTDLHPEVIAVLGEKVINIPFGMPGTMELPEHVRPYVKGNRAAFLQNHGALSWGEDMKEAYFNMETLENYCKLYTIVTKVIGRPTLVPEYAQKELFQYYAELDKDL